MFQREGTTIDINSRNGSDFHESKLLSQEGPVRAYNGGILSMFWSEMERHTYAQVTGPKFRIDKKSLGNVNCKSESHWRVGSCQHQAASFVHYRQKIECRTLLE